MRNSFMFKLTALIGAAGLIGVCAGFFLASPTTTIAGALAFVASVYYGPVGCIELYEEEI